jgi:signal transduction histidine kinase
MARVQSASMLPFACGIYVSAACGKPGAMQAMSATEPFDAAESLLARIAEATAPLTGAAFFRALVENFAQALAFREVFVTECIGPDATRVRMLCHWMAGGFAENDEYDLAGTPCLRTIAGRSTTFIGDALETLYPSWPGNLAYLGVPIFEADGTTVAGHLAFYDDRPRENIAALPVFRILAARAGAELLRLRAETRARRHLATAAQAARRAVMHDLASAIAHEINQPLTSVLAYAQACARLLKSGEATPADTLQCLERIVSEAERAAAIAQRLRRFVGRDDLPHAESRVDEIIVDALALTRSQAVATGVATVVELAPGLPPVRGAAVQLQQVLVNLLRNAIEAAASSATQVRQVRLGAHAADGAVEIVVTDTGPGFGPGVAAHLFEPYFTTKPDGMGIGLSVSRGIAEAHGGRLAGTSLAGGGARFSLTLPAAHVTQPGFPTN